MEDEHNASQTQQKRANSASTQGTPLVDFLAILCVLIATKLVFGVLLQLVKADCPLTSIGCLRKNGVER